jgi:hypothetical protein
MNPSPGRHRRERDRDRRVFTPRRVRRIEGSLLLLLGTAAVILSTLRPTTPSAPHLCFVCGPHAGVVAFANVALFIPIGAGLALLGVRLQLAVFIAAAATFLIETLQLALPLGHTASVADVLTNTLGAALGHYIAARRRAFVYPRSRAAFRYAIAISAAWLFMLVLTAVAFLPSVPAGRYSAQWGSTLESADRYPGDVVSAHVSGLTLTSGPVAASGTLLEAMRDGARVEATIVPGAMPLRVSPIVRLIRSDSAEVLMLGQHRDDLVFRARIIGTGLRFVTPMVVMPNALLREDRGERPVVVVGGRREPGRLRVGALGGDAILDLHAGAGWLLFAPPGRGVQASANMLSALWAGAPLFAAAYWGARGARRRARRAGDAMRMRGAGGRILAMLPAFIALAALGLAGISRLFGLSIPAWGVWIGVVTAIGAGLTLGASLALAHDDRAHGSSRREAASPNELPRATQTASA